MALPPAFLEELRARTPLAAVVGRRVKLARSGRQFKGCCPFHGEKTPSFYVYDDHYHCFGCGAHGDAVSFVMQSQGAGFREAVEQLAAEAGMEVPKASPEAAEAERRKLDLHGVLEAAATAFHRKLFLPEGARALDYLRGRGLTDDTIRRFGLGWSGEGRGALTAELARDNVAPDQLTAAGLLTPAQDDRPAREMFFNRVMFPIRDRRGRVISFGGRILGDGQPKYLNGPETDLFSKRRTLFGLDFAREAARGGASVVAVEGYMDVIALHQAGFAGAVAPLGTALTDEQLEELWRLSPAPVLCFDGDAAGRRATLRAIQMALPHLTSEKTFTIVSLPENQDPDSVVRRDGASAFKFRLDQASAIWRVLYFTLRDEVGVDTPERRAKLRHLLDGFSRQIREKNLSSEARSELFNLYFEHRRSKVKRGAIVVSPPPIDDLDFERGQLERARQITAILLNHLDIFDDVEEAWASLALPDMLYRVRTEVRAWIDDGKPDESEMLQSHLLSRGWADEVQRILSNTPLPMDRNALKSASRTEAVLAWWYYFGLMAGLERLEAEVLEAKQQLIERWDTESERRFVNLVAVSKRLRAGEDSDDNL